MLASELYLIRRLNERNSDRGHAADGNRHQAKPGPTVTTEVLQAAERALGFQLPELLRAVYVKLGNGGFGPEYGIVGIKGGFEVDKCSLEACYERMLQLEQNNSLWR